VRSVDSQAHKTASNETGNGDGHDPREEQEEESLPVNGPEGAVAETNADSRASDAHRGRDGERVLREDENGNSSTHLHGRTTAGRVVGELVTHNYSSEMKMLAKVVVKGERKHKASSESRE
jgi:hypothetical protein